MSFPKWFNLDSLRSGRPAGPGEVPREGLGFVVEIDKQGLAKSCLDEATRMAIVAGVERLVGEESPDVLYQHLSLEVGDGTGLGDRHSCSIADGKDVRRYVALERVRINRYEAQFVSQSGGSGHELGSTVQRNHYRQIKVDHSFVVGDELTCGAIDLASVELGDEHDTLLLEKAAETMGRYGRGEGTVERRHVGQLDLVSDPRFWKYQSARKQNSSGATGHLIGRSTTLTTSRPPENPSSAAASAVAPSTS